MSKHEVYCPSCGCQMVQRNGKYGLFYGCTGYPVCRNTMTRREAELAAEPPELEDEDDGGEPWENQF